MARAVLFYTRTIGGQQVRANYKSFEDAKQQAEHEEKLTDERVVDRIEVKGEVVWTSPEDGSSTYDPTYRQRPETGGEWGSESE